MVFDRKKLQRLAARLIKSLK